MRFLITIPPSPFHKVMKVAFLENFLTIRGSTVALYDYAHYNETLLHHESIVITQPFEAVENHQDASQDVYDKFEKRFPTFYYGDVGEIQAIVDREKPDVLYILKYGLRDGKYDAFQNTKTLMHCVFDPREPHGDSFCVISPWLNTSYQTQCPVLPHMVNLPNVEGDLRAQLGIPQQAVVFGRHGGFQEFDHPVAQAAVARLAASHPDMYFVFMNTAVFTPPQKNVLFLDKCTDPVYKVQFINTCDAMLYARSRGETFGLAIAEFSSRNKPVFAPSEAPEQMHRTLLQDKAYWYTDEEDLCAQLVAFRPDVAKHLDWNMHKAYTPENVMSIFQDQLTAVMRPDRLCYVTAFLDIKRDQWQHFQRSVATYFQEFQPMLDMFLHHPDAPEHDFVIFMDHAHAHHLPRVLPPNIMVQEIDEMYLQDRSPLWQRMEREEAIMASEAYQTIVRHRLHHPEHCNPKYTMINHCKVDFLQLAMEVVPKATHFAWVDFGYCKTPESMPSRFLDLAKVEKSKVNYTLINQINPAMDGKVLYTLQHAPEKVGGFFFCGSKTAILAYRNLYHAMHQALHEHNVVDDDQHVALLCYLQKPDLFCMHHLGGFHRALTTFQKA